MPKCGADKKSSKIPNNVISQGSIALMEYYILCYFLSPTQEFAENAVTNYYRVDGSTQQRVALSHFWMGQVQIQQGHPLWGLQGSLPSLLASSNFWQLRWFSWACGSTTSISPSVFTLPSPHVSVTHRSLPLSYKDTWKQLLKLAIAFRVHLNNPM